MKKNILLIDVNYNADGSVHTAFISGEHDTIYAAWYSDFTERKLKNAMNRLERCMGGNVEFVRREHR